jgi:ABC-type molybdate transport system substrate-binding protein
VGKVDRVALPAVPGLVNRYVAAVVKASTHREAAEAYVAALRGDAGQTALRAAGFEVLPG